MKKKETRLYNVLFPVWMLILFPGVWLIVLPGNFIIDSLVIIASMFALRVADKKKWYKKHILKIFIFGFLSDMIGALLPLTVTISFPADILGDELFLTLPAVVLAAALIFVFNYFITFRKEDKGLRLKVSLIFAVATAPYTFLIPTRWLYMI